MRRDIITVDDEGGREALTAPCFEVPEDQAIIKSLFDDLLDTAKWCEQHHTMGCLAVSANQIGDQYNAFVMKFGSDWLSIMNPIVVSASDQKRPSAERCLSLPKRPAITRMRHKVIKIQWTDPATGREMSRKFHDRDARVVQHEMDHGRGVLI